VTAGPAAGQTYAVEAGGAVLGRARENGVAIQDEHLSRHHAQIAFQDGAFWLADLGSRNGTFVNRQRLTSPRQLRSGDEITFGETRLAVNVEVGAP
jgi:pSer/pThr/pTyr-binding forkhead associated (FHA) protein